MQHTPVPEDTAHQMLMSLLQYLSTFRSETLGKLEGNVEWHKLKVLVRQAQVLQSYEAKQLPCLEVTDLSVALSHSQSHMAPGS